jgi:uncharacterized cupin superfamily protein
MADWTSTDDVRRLPAVGEAADPAYWRDYGVGDDYVERWHNVGSALGVTAFGINACTGDPGDVLMVEHDEVAYGGQDEVYVVLAGRARFTLDGREVELGPGGAVHCPARVHRLAVALEPATTVVAVGAYPDRAYGADS